QEVNQSDVETAKSYIKAAGQGDADAQSGLGVMYEQGRGVDQSNVETIRWYTKARNLQPLSDTGQVSDAMNTTSSLAHPWKGLALAVGPL
ncbi:hypothetical protein DFQ27_004938, partial [Actinomortierella ambigua]